LTLIAVKHSTVAYITRISKIVKDENPTEVRFKLLL